MDNENRILQGNKKELTIRDEYTYHILSVLASNLETMTVQAPQPPSPQANLVPVSNTVTRS